MKNISTFIRSQWDKPTVRNNLRDTFRFIQWHIDESVTNRGARHRKSVAKVLMYGNSRTENVKNYLKFNTIIQVFLEEVSF